jgi:DNA polymerase-3 subunit epsilon
MILFFDTETTGFPDWKLSLSHESQPYIVQLAAQLCDEYGRTLAEMCVVIDNDVDIPERASAVHGITRERAAEIGIPADVAIDLFNHLYVKADLIVAHNVNFDKKITEIAWARRLDWTPIPKPTFCTMNASAPVVNIPPTEKMLAAGFTKPKAPKLEECVKHFFGEELSGAHDAMIDVIACRRVFFHLKSLEQNAAGQEIAA